MGRTGAAAYDPSVADYRNVPRCAQGGIRIAHVTGENTGRIVLLPARSAGEVPA